MRRILLCILLLLCGNCRGEKASISLTNPAPSLRAEDYPSIMECHTRKANIIKGLDTTLKIHATFFTPTFIEAYIKRIHKLFQLTAKEKETLEKQMMPDREKYYTIFISTETTDENWNDFDRKNSIWHVLLSADENKSVIPLEIKKVSKINATLREMFPYIDSFHHAYYIHFPRTLSDGQPLLTNQTRRMGLHLAGPLGSTELVWDLQ